MTTTIDNKSNDLSRAHGIDAAGILPSGRKIWLRPATDSDLQWMHQLITLEISSDVGSVDVMCVVRSHNADAFWPIERVADDEQPS